MPFSRRSFLIRVGQAGGLGAAYLSMQGLGLIPSSSSAAEPLPAPATQPNGLSVVILGAGIAGLVAAYELRALGYTCTILEATNRPGGRNHTIRGGDEIVFTDGTRQQCNFDPGNYQNIGPSRLPSNHKTMLGYCKKLGVALEVEVNTSRSSMLQNDAANDGKPVVQRQAINDTRGHLSELLSKCIHAGALDAEMSKSDLDRMLVFLQTYGPLDQAGKYVGSDRAGFSVDPGAGEDDGVNSVPQTMHMLLDENFWDGMLYEEQNDWQATMFQPVGGMDHIPNAFAKELGNIIRYNSPVTELRKTTRGVEVSYQHDGAPQSLTADFCFCAMPLIPLRKIKNNLSAPYRKVIDDCTYDGYYKIAWESRRFWEQDYNIYGGLEFLNEGCSPVWLPSHAMFSDRGVLVSGYAQCLGTPFDVLTLPQKFAESRKSIEHLHPGHSHELEKPIFVGWHKIPYQDGSWIATYGPGQPEYEPSDIVSMGHRRGGKYANPGYTTLLQPDGPIYFVGDHVSYLIGWQEGAALSSLRAIRILHERVTASHANHAA